MAEILTRVPPHFAPAQPHFVGSGRCANALVAILRGMSSFLFILRHLLAWGGAFIVALVLWNIAFSRSPNWVFGLAVTVTLLYQAIVAFSHTRRVKLIAERLDSTALASRHRRRVEIPLSAAEAFDLVEAAIRELPYMENVEPRATACRCARS